MLYWLGTKGGTQPYKNPVDSNAVTVTASREENSSLDEDEVSSEDEYSTFMAGRFVQHRHQSGEEEEDNYTASDEPNSWMAVALGGGAQAKVTHYCLRHGCQGDAEHGSWNVLRHWDLEASTDGQAWTTLRSLADAGFSTAGWVVQGDKGAFSHFRIRQTGENSSSSHELACAGIELYGELLPPAAPV